MDFFPCKNSSNYNNYLIKPIFGFIIYRLSLANFKASLNVQLKCFIKYIITIVALLDFPS